MAKAPGTSTTLKHSRGVRREGGRGYWDFDVDVNESLNTHREA